MNEAHVRLALVPSAWYSLSNNNVVELEYRAAAKLDIMIGKGPSEQALSCTCCAL